MLQTFGGGDDWVSWIYGNHQHHSLYRSDDISGLIMRANVVIAQIVIFAIIFAVLVITEPPAEEKKRKKKATTWIKNKTKDKKK